MLGFNALLEIVIMCLEYSILSNSGHTVCVCGINESDHVVGIINLFSFYRSFSNFRILVYIAPISALSLLPPLPTARRMRHALCGETGVVDLV